VDDKRVDEQTGERMRFSSGILPAYARRSPKVNDVLAVLYLRGLSTGDFRPALEQLLGEDAAGLWPSTIGRLCKGVGGRARALPAALAALSPLRLLVRRRRPRVDPAR
jgi:putative transposase